MKKLSIILIALFAVGCSSQKSFNTVGGSKSDATVKMAYEYGLFERPVVNHQEAHDKAVKRCAAWGYTGAESFDNGYKTCIAQNYQSGGCNAYRVTKEFQCID